MQIKEVELNEAHAALQCCLRRLQLKQVPDVCRKQMSIITFYLSLFGLGVPKPHPHTIRV
jgi:hypothetical protein